MKRNLQVAAFTVAFAILACFDVKAQSPGGVAPAAWYRADGPGTVFSDAGTTAAANNATVQQWNEAKGSGYNLLQATASARPVFSNSSALANFNPTVTFDGSNDFMQFTAGTGVNVIDRANGSIYTAGFVNTMKQSGFAGFNATMDYPGLHVFGSNNKLLFFTGGPGYQGLSASAMTATTFFTAGSGWQNGAGTNASYAAATVSLNGTRTDYNGSQLLNANLSTGARDFRIGADNNYGSFSGQLNEILVFEDKLTSDQMDRVETYLAVKYGTTYAGGTRDYINSAGTAVWSASANSGLGNNIAGIGRDDAGALNQKQSWSTNAGAQVLIGTGSLANTNAGNGAALTNGQFLVWGDNGLAKSPNVVISGISGISHRFASIWKVQNTGSVGTVRVAWAKNFSNLSLIQSTDNVINSSDVVTNMSSNETTINGVVYNYADVTLTNGQYFTFAAKVAAPGGVNTDLRVWLKSDNGFTPAQWNDNSGNSNHYTQTNASRQPFTATASYNFNPVVDFGTTGNDGRFMVVPAGKPYSANGTSSSVFTVNLDRSVGGYADILGFGATTTTASFINANLPVFTRLGTSVVNYPYADASPALPSVTVNRLYLNDVSFTVGAAGIKYGQDGTTGSNTQTFAAVYSRHADGSVLGSQPEVRNGLIGEVIAYERDLSEPEKQRVRTYTAIKYGITLPHNYIASDGTTILWDQTTNAGYNKNIAGIASDEGSALVQKQSKSINAGNQVLLGTTGLSNSNALNGNALTNGQSLVWGDNGLAKSLSTSHNTVIGGNQINLRFAAVWKVQNTGSVGTVRVAWPTGIVNLQLIQSSDNVINTSDTHTAMSGIATINGISYNYADVTLANGSYFSFAGYIAGPGGVGQDLSLWYKADSGVETDGNNKVTGWNNSTATDVKLTMSSASGYIPYNDQTTKSWNFNPTLSFDGTNNYLRNTTTDYLNTAGSVHYITVARLNASASSYNSIFSIAGNDDGFFLFPQSGLIYPMPAIGNVFGAAAAGPGSANRFGIYSAILPKTGTPANQRGFYNGLQKVYTSPYPLTGGFYSLPTKGAYIGADGATADNPNGDIAEVIVYHEPAGGDMTNTNLAKIHSYLAIKYGVTLDQSTPQNYVNSSNAVVRDAAANVGYQNNIAGIARDDQGGLYQKQSNSVNSGGQVVIGTTGLANTNSANTEPLSNGQFLIWGDNGLAKAPTVSIGSISGLPYNRFASIWKVQNTSSVGTVRVAWVKGYANLKLVQSTDNVIDLSDEITDMSSTVTIGGKEYAYADVTLADGSYFTFAAFVQGPGGVTNNLNYWYRADKLVGATVEDADVDDWTDFTSGTTISQLGDNDLPKFKPGNSAYFNFNPGLNYTAGAQTLGNTNVQTVTALNFDIYTLTKEGLASGGGNSRVFSSLVDNITTTGGIRHWDGIGLNQNGTLERVNTARAQTYFANPGNINYAAGYPSIMYNTFTNTTAAKGLNGAANGTTATYAANGQMAGGHAIGSTAFSGNGSDNAGFIGNIGEVIIYGNGNNSPAERNKVESYLAIKYGLTLANSNNYTTSKDVVVWDATANSGYYTNVAGIGNDVLSALDQKQSRSQQTNTNSQVTIGLGGIAETNLANANQLTDGQFLVWGDNGNTQAMTNTASTYTAFVYSGSINNARRMNRIWKVQNANVTSDVLVRFPVASVGTTTLANDACAGYVIVFASDAAFSSNVTSTPLTVNGTDYEAVHSFPAGASYFTFAKVTPITTGTVYLPMVVEETTQYNDNCGTGEWTYFRKTDDNSLKFFATSGIGSAVLNNLTVKVTPEGVTYEDGTKTTRLMPRILNVTNSAGGTFAAGKVRVYYSASELAATQLSGAQVNSWFKYEGAAEEVLANVYSTGSLDGTKTTQLTPNATGVEDGVNYVEFHNITSFSSFIYLSTTSANPLPVTLTYFKAAKEGGVASLKWGTTEEVNNKGFEIQRSADARSWHVLGFVENQTGGDSKEALSYNYTDGAPLAGTNYYRLRQIDMDDSFQYSSIATVKFEGDKGSLYVYPNPVVNGSLSLNLPRTGSYKASVINISGVEVLNLKNSGATLDVKALPGGVYVLKVVYDNGDVYTKTFLVK